MKHVKNLHGTKTKNRQCDFCSYASYSGYNLRLHVTKVHKGFSMKSEKCIHCEKKTTNMKLHVKTYHDRKCLYCEKEPKNMKVHVNKYHKKEHKCKVCDKIFTNFNHLKVHNRIHSGEKPFVCNQCDKAFSYLPTFKNHRLLHNRAKAYQEQHWPGEGQH